MPLEGTLVKYDLGMTYSECPLQEEEVLEPAITWRLKSPFLAKLMNLTEALVTSI